MRKIECRKKANLLDRKIIVSIIKREYEKEKYKIEEKITEEIMKKLSEQIAVMMEKEIYKGETK